jgi:hypothetical protein
MPDTGRLAVDTPQFVPEGDPTSGYPCVAYNGTGAGLRAAAVRPVTPIYPKRDFRSWIELYLCTNLLRTGWDVRCFPEIEVWHCRASGSSRPASAYYGLRNYLWYVFKFYPWPLALTESLHHLGSRVRLTLQGQIPAPLLLRALRDGLCDLSDVHRVRTPVKADLIEYLHRVRRHGNWHGIAPEIIPFPGIDALIE